MLYNNAYAGFAGGRHPELLGSKVREGWPEVADFNDSKMRTVMAGSPNRWGWTSTTPRSCALTPR